MRFLLILIFLSFNCTLQARTITVGAGKTFTSLKKAIEHAIDRDTILLFSGTYKEGSLTITKQIALLGQNNPVLDGENKYEILLVSGNNITVKGIQFKNSGYSSMNDFASVKLVDCSNVRVENNIITNAFFAIHVSNSKNIIIRGNNITGLPKAEQLTGNGIHLWKSGTAFIENNTVYGHRDGIYFEFVTNSLIRNNRCEKNIRYGLHFMFSNDDIYNNNTFSDNGAGVAVMYSKKVKMEGNRFEKNWGPSAYGLLLKDITDSYITHNTFSKNTTGIHMEGSSRMEIQKNIFTSNGWALRVQASCDDNFFHHNNFSGNSFDVGTNGTMVLNKFENNYWDKYDGYDINKDGSGDVPYHPVSMYSVITEQNPNALILLRSFTVQLLDKAEKAIPSLTPEHLIDSKPTMKPNRL
ncbi:MAG TPA: nitrous oxide reductase family maturation protein NosD [Chitinophagaceae bacterium]|nr:nitrous oxide reductase family maturation protein NosD [Chitinophagaceae bacterium]